MSRDDDWVQRLRAKDWCDRTLLIRIDDRKVVSGSYLEAVVKRVDV